jgi:transglycosylase-like protein with SLT domain/uncharacterized protein DUF4124
MTELDRDGRFEERRGERRQGDRRQAERAGVVDRRRGDRRTSTGAGVLLALAAMAVVPEARADVYTRINSSGVTEATNLPSAKDFKLTYRSKGIVIHSPGFQLRPSANHDFDEHIQAAAALHGISQDLIRAVIQVESQFDRLAISTAGARGLMQLMPATARSMGVADSFDARQNIFGGTRYLRSLLGRYGGDVTLAAAAYNAGEGAVARYNGIPPYKETQNYVRKVNALLGGAVAAVAAEIPALFIAAGEGSRPIQAPARASAFAARAKAPAVKPGPRIYYRWKDAKGVVHMTQAPPPTGEYSTVKSTD